MSTATGRWQAARNMLCVRLDNIGDVLMTTPAIRALKQQNRGRRITLLASPAGAEAARHVAEIDAVLPYQAPWVAGAQPPRPAADITLRTALAEAAFDAAVIFTVYSQSPLPAALMCYLAGIPLRLAHCRENPYHLLTDWIGESDPRPATRHETQRQLDLVAAVGASTDDTGLGFRVPHRAHVGAAQVLARLGIGPGERLLVVHPGASAASRRYPPEDYAAAVRTLLQQASDWHVVISGSTAESGLARTLCRLAGRPGRVHDVAGMFDLAGLAALIARASVLLSNNTGPVHLAAALGTPVVVLYALTNPQHTPWQVPARVLYHDVPCRYCYRSLCPRGHNECLRLVPPGMVADAVQELADSAAAPGTAMQLPRLPRCDGAERFGLQPGG